MTKIPWFALLATLVACGVESDTDPVDEPVLSRGTWTVGQSELANDCGSDGVLFPFGPAPVVIEQRAGAVTLTADGEARTYSVDGHRWVRERHETMDDCSASLVETWVVNGLERRRLSGSYEADLELSGECDVPMVHSCRVRYAVWGTRR